MVKKTGLFYSANTDSTADIGRQIQRAFREEGIEVEDLPNGTKEDLKKYNNIIAGAPTVSGGELPGYWDALLPAIESMNLTGKKIAIFGLGDQDKYPYNFVDGIGILAETFAKRGAAMVGFTSTDGYEFKESKAVVNNKFKGLAIDVDNQYDKTEERIKSWVKQLSRELQEIEFTDADSFTC